MEGINNRYVLMALIADPYNSSYGKALKSGLEIEFQLWDGRIISVSNFKEEGKIPDFRTSNYWFPDHIVVPLMDKLIIENRSFVLSAGRGDLRCTIIWQVKS
ncbi:MAG: hypothetical protein WC663_01970 [Patescibacteria group bacterium]|jgi:hypothetical protein